MHHIFQKFIDLLSAADNSADFSELMTITAAALDLSCFAYLLLPDTPKGPPRLISTYPSQWTAHYLRQNYERIDPVVAEAVQTPEPFRWGIDVPSEYRSPAQRQLLDEASQFGIRLGFTVPIHDGRGPIAALTFAADRQAAGFERCITLHSRVLQLMAMYFHAHVSRKLTADYRIDGVRLSPREFECLEWATRGKSAWEIGRILGISRNTVACHLDNVKKKLGVRTIVQAAMRLAAARKE